MPQWDLVGRQHVLAAISEADRLGSAEFLARYRFRRARAVSLWHGGNEYDPLALLGVACLRATGHAPGTSEIDDAVTAQVLKQLGFDVVVDEDALAAAQAAATRRVTSRAAASRADTDGPAPRSPRSPSSPRPSRSSAPAKAPRTKPAEIAPKVCPTCYMALPVTGICDNCD